MGITYGDYLIDSGHYDITPEQEREQEAREECARLGLDPDDYAADGAFVWMVVDQEMRQARHPMDESMRRTQQIILRHEAFNAGVKAARKIVNKWADDITAAGDQFDKGGDIFRISGLLDRICTEIDALVAPHSPQQRQQDGSGA